jgi:hypothetical protein
MPNYLQGKPLIKILRGDRMSFKFRPSQRIGIAELLLKLVSKPVTFAKASRTCLIIPASRPVGFMKMATSSA